MKSDCTLISETSLVIYIALMDFPSGAQFSSVQSCPTLQHARPPCPSPTPGVSSNSCPLNQQCHPAISSSVIHFSFCIQSFPESGSFVMSWLFTSGGQSIGASTSFSVSILTMNIQDWFSLELIVLISLQSKRLSRIFSSSTIQKHQFFSTQPSLWFNSHTHTWLLEKP